MADAPAPLGAGLRVGGSLVVGLCGLGATLLAALPGVAAGLLLLLDYSLGGSLDVVRGLIAGLLWPEPGFGLLHRQSLVMHPLAGALWSLAGAALGLAGTAMALAEWRLGRPGWRAALPAWVASAWCGGVPVAVLLAPAAAMQLVGIAVARHAAGLASPMLDAPMPDGGAVGRLGTGGLPAGEAWRLVGVSDPARQAAALALLGEGEPPPPGEHVALFCAGPPATPVDGAAEALLRAAAAAGLALRALPMDGAGGLGTVLALPAGWRPVAYLVPAGGVLVVRR